MMSHVLLLSCPDRFGVVAATAEFIAGERGNIIHAEQYVKGGVGGDGSVFFQRIEFELTNDRSAADFLADFQTVADRFAMNVDLRDNSVPIPTAIMCSKQPHCLYDLLTRWRSGEMQMDLRVVISNHPDHRDIVEHMDLPFVHLPVTKDTKPQQESEVLATLAEHGVELTVMARYMQILSDSFVPASSPCGKSSTSTTPSSPRIRRSEPVSPGTRTRRQADRCNRPLRNCRPRRGSDHRSRHSSCNAS